MTFDDELDRDVRSLRLSGWGRVAASGVPVPFLVLDAEGVPVEPIQRFLREFVARGHAAGSVRSYAFDLLRWWRFLQAVGVAWDRASPAEVRDFVLWLQQASKSRRAPRTRSLATAGQVNAVTRKPYLGSGPDLPADRQAARRAEPDDQVGHTRWTRLKQADEHNRRVVGSPARGGPQGLRRAQAAEPGVRAATDDQ